MRARRGGGPYLALVGVEVALMFGLAEGNAAHSVPVVPGGPVVVAQQAEDAIALQRPVPAHDEPALPGLALLLRGEDAGSRGERGHRGTARGHGVTRALRGVTGALPGRQSPASPR